MAIMAKFYFVRKIVIIQVYASTDDIVMLLYINHIPNNSCTLIDGTDGTDGTDGRFQWKIRHARRSSHKELWITFAYGFISVM